MTDIEFFERQIAKAERGLRVSQCRPGHTDYELGQIREKIAHLRAGLDALKKVLE